MMDLPTIREVEAMELVESAGPEGLPRQGFHLGGTLTRQGYAAIVNKWTKRRYILTDLGRAQLARWRAMHRQASSNGRHCDDPARVDGSDGSRTTEHACTRVRSTEVGRAWFQGNHYDVCEAKRAEAIKLGAKAVRPRDLVPIIRAWREAGWGK